jgi:transposase
MRRSRRDEEPRGNITPGPLIPAKRPVPRDEGRPTASAAHLLPLYSRGPTRAEALAKQAMAAEHDALEAANRKIAELERKVGQQALELDFFQQTLRRFKEPRPAPSVPGVNAFSRRSKR